MENGDWEVPEVQRLTRGEQREQNRRRLLSAAERVIAARGIHAASLDAVAAEAGLTKGAVYSNFESKEDLILEVIRHRLAQEAEAQAARRLDPGGDDLIDRFGEHWVETVRGGHETFTRLIAEFMVHASRNPAHREDLIALLFPVAPPDPHPLAPPGSELAKLPAQHIDAILKALDIGMEMLTMVAPDRCPPELFAVALRLLAGEEIDAGGIR